MFLNPLHFFLLPFGEFFAAGSSTSIIFHYTPLFFFSHFLKRNFPFNVSLIWGEPKVKIQDIFHRFKEALLPPKNQTHLQFLCPRHPFRYKMQGWQLTTAACHNILLFFFFSSPVLILFPWTELFLSKMRVSYASSFFSMIIFTLLAFFMRTFPSHLLVSVIPSVKEHNSNVKDVQNRRVRGWESWRGRGDVRNQKEEKVKLILLVGSFSPGHEKILFTSLAWKSRQSREGRIQRRRMEKSKEKALFDSFHRLSWHILRRKTLWSLEWKVLLSFLLCFPNSLTFWRWGMPRGRDEEKLGHILLFWLNFLGWKTCFWSGNVTSYISSKEGEKNWKCILNHTRDWSRNPWLHFQYYFLRSNRFMHYTVFLSPYFSCHPLRLFWNLQREIHLWEFRTWRRRDRTTRVTGEWSFRCHKTFFCQTDSHRRRRDLSSFLSSVTCSVYIIFPGMYPLFSSEPEFVPLLNTVTPKSSFIVLGQIQFSLLSSLPFIWRRHIKGDNRKETFFPYYSYTFQSFLWHVVSPPNKMSRRYFLVMRTNTSQVENLKKFMEWNIHHQISKGETPLLSFFEISFFYLFLEDLFFEWE